MLLHCWRIARHSQPARAPSPVPVTFALLFSFLLIALLVHNIHQLSQSLVPTAAGENALRSRRLQRRPWESPEISSREDLRSTRPVGSPADKVRADTTKTLVDAMQLRTSNAAPAAHTGMHGGLFNFRAPDRMLVAKAYRMSNNTIVAIVQRPIPAPNPSQCSFGKYNSTHVTFNQVSWNVERAYVGPMSVVCTFGPGLPSNFASIPAQTKLQIHGLVDDWHEAQAIPVFDFRPQLTKVFGWTVCLPALHGDLRYKWLAQWMSHYVEKLGVQHAFIYSTMTPSLTLAQLADQGVQYANTHASLLDIASQVPFWPINNAQDYTMYDCLTLNRHIHTEWVMFQDFDEVLSIPSDFSSPLSFFRSFKRASALTFGSWGIDMQSCLPAESVTESDRHWPWIARGKRKPEPHCGIMCTVKDEGNRKYALQPQHHCTLAVHEVLDNMRTVHHIPANYGCLLQFQGAASNSQPIDCT